MRRLDDAETKKARWPLLHLSVGKGCAAGPLIDGRTIVAREVDVLVENFLHSPPQPTQPIIETLTARDGY